MSIGIQSEDPVKSEQLKKEAGDFKLLYEAHWNSKISCVANRRKKLRQINKPNVLPLTRDMVVLRDFLLDQMKQLTTISNPTYKQWLLLAQILIVRMCMFNKRRIAEVDELKVSDYAQRPDDANEEILGILNVTERTLVERYIKNMLKDIVLD